MQEYRLAHNYEVSAILAFLHEEVCTKERDYVIIILNCIESNRIEQVIFKFA